MLRERTERGGALRRGIGIALFGIAAGIITGAEGATGTKQEQDTRSQQTFATVCGRCHPVERITGMRRTRSQWEETITAMITTRGAQISDDEFDTVLTYLSAEYGRVDVNRAAPEDIEEVLGISTGMAASIVSYRKEHGPFENFEALLMVPGVNREAIEKKRDAITF
jgi:competence ComEA-like helix-hairpin-helix protein